MNKKFSTLVATLLLSGALFTLNAATSLTDFDALAGVELAADGNSLKLTDNVVLENQKDYLLIDKDNFVLDGNGKELTGHVVITGKNVTVKNLTINFKNTFAEGEDGTVAVNKTAITVIADGVTLEGNTINGSTNHFLVNGITVFPTGNKGKIVVKNNTIKKADGVVGDTFSTGFQIAGDYTLSDTGCESVTATNKTVADLSTLQLTVSGNKYEMCTTDLSYTTGWSETEAAKQGVVIASQVTPIVDETTGNITNAGAIKGAVEKAVEGASIVFNGTAEQLAEALNNVTENIPVKTNEGIVVAGVEQLDATIKGYNLVANISDKDSYETSGYYLLVIKGDRGSYAITADKDGKPTCVDVNDLTEKQAKDETNLWKMKQTLDDDHKYTFTFTNKAGKVLTVEQEDGDVDFFQSAANAPYGYGVVFNLNGANLNDKDAKPHYFGLYKSVDHKLTADQLNWYENGGFSMSFDLKKDEVLEGTAPFAGRLTATAANGAATEFSLVNEDGKYIVAKRTNAAGTEVNNYIYAFELVSKKTMAEELKITDPKKRTLFNEFSFYYKPTSADDDLQAIEKLDSIKVQVINEDGILEEALVGSYLLSTENTKTLGASIEFGLTPVVINMGDNVVVPEEFLKNQKGFVTIKQLNEKTDDLYFAANKCSNTGYGLVKSYGNPLEIQWAVQYDSEKKEYTLVNREDNTIKIAGIDYKFLRENGDKEDNIYAYGANKYEIEFVPAGESKDFYMYLGDVKNQKFKMAHWSGVYNNRAWFTADEDANALISIDEERALEFTAHNGKVAADTMKVATYVNYYDADKKEWKKQDHKLEVPVYTFSTKEGKFVDNGKFIYTNESTATATRLVIRNNGEHYNLRPLKEEDGKEVMACQKIYVGTSNEEAGFLYTTYGLYVTDKNDLFDVVKNDRPEYRRLGATLATDGFTSKVDTAKFFRTNGVKNLYLYENTMNRNTDKERSLNFLGEVQSDYLPENVQLPFVVDTAFVRNDTPKPLYLLAVRTTEVKPQEDVPCEVPGHGMDCEHAVKGHEGYRTGDYLVTLDDSLNIKGLDVKFNGYTRLSFVPAKHIGDTLQIMSSKWTNSKDEDEVAKDSIFFSSTDKKGNVSQLDVNAAAFAFKLVDPKKAVDEGMVDFYIENTYNDQVRYVHVLNSVPVLVEDLHQASTFNVEAAAEGETPTANDEITADEVLVVAGNGFVTIKGAEGKNVVITNVLGQTIANTVITSSEATISAPAGVVVVAVEGEAAVKAIVK